MKYMITACVLCLMINTLVFKVLKNGETEIPFYISLTMFILSFIVCIFVWKKWKLMKDPNIDAPGTELQNNSNMNLKILSLKYIHPVEV